MPKQAALFDDVRVATTTGRGVRKAKASASPSNTVPPIYEAAGKKIGWRDGVKALWCIVRYGLFG